MGLINKFYKKWHQDQNIVAQTAFNIVNPNKNVIKFESPKYLQVVDTTINLKSLNTQKLNRKLNWGYLQQLSTMNRNQINENRRFQKFLADLLLIEIGPSERERRLNILKMEISQKQSKSMLKKLKKSNFLKKRVKPKIINV